MSKLCTACAVSLFAVCASVRSQQSWVQRSEIGSTGLLLADSPLQPRWLEPFPTPSAGASKLYEFHGNGFHRRPEPLPVAINYARAATYDPIGQRFVVYCSAVPQPGGGTAAVVCTYDGARWSVVPTIGTPPPDRRLPVFRFDPQRGSLLLFGGHLDVSVFAHLADTWELVGDTWTQLAVTGPAPRSAAACARTAAGSLLLFGGMTTSGVGNDTWQWNGVSWTQLAPATVPPARSGHTMTFEASSGRPMMFGGRDATLGTGLASLRSDLWSWNGSDWQLEPSPPVAALVQPHLTIDDGELLLVGRVPTTSQFGTLIDNSQAVVHVQARNGSTWSSRFVSAPLDETSGSAAAFDGLRGEIVQFGGRAIGGQPYLDQTATWNGGWTRHAPAVRPAARGSAGLAFDVLRGNTVLFGGLQGSTMLGDTWTWDGTGWQAQTTAVAPAARYNQTMAFDPSRGGVVLYGGATFVTAFTDTWLWNGTTWTPIATPTVPTTPIGQLAFDDSRQVLALYGDGGHSAASELWELGPGGWVLANNTAPYFGRLAYDPQAGNLVVMHSTGRADLVAGAWVLSTTQRMNGTWLLTETNRGVLLAGGPLVFESTPAPAAAASYGSGCGPLGEVTCAFDRAAAYGVVVTTEVRAHEANAPTFLFYGATARDLPLGGGCASYLDDVLLAIGAVAMGNAWATFPLAIPVTSSLAGVELFAQPVTLHNGGIGIGNGASLRIGL